MLKYYWFNWKSKVITCKVVNKDQAKIRKGENGH